MSIYLSTPGYSELELEVEDLPDNPGTYILNPALNIIKFDAPNLDYNLIENVNDASLVLFAIDGTIRTHILTQRESLQKSLTFRFLDTSDRDDFITFIKVAQGQYIKLTDDTVEKIFLPTDPASIFNDDGRANGIGQDVGSLKHSITLTVRIWDK